MPNYCPHISLGFLYFSCHPCQSCGFIQNQKNVIIWNYMVRCYENLVLGSYRSIFVNSSRNLILGLSSAVCLEWCAVVWEWMALVLSWPRPCRSPFCIWSFEFSRDAAFISWKSLNHWEKQCFARALLNQCFSIWSWQEATVEKQGYCQ